MNLDLQIEKQRLKQVWLTLPYKAGVLMVAFSKDRFKYQNWLDNYPEAWVPRKKNSKWGGKKKNNSGRALLVQSGRLRRSIQIFSTTGNSVTIGSDVPYASVHNDGYRMGQIQQVATYTRKRFIKARKGTGVYSIKTRKEGMKTVSTLASEIQVAAHTRRVDQRIPRRRFMGESKYLTMQISRMIEAEMMKIFN